jgi:aspartate/methionine/tyrosine aminotransferase
MRSNRQVNQVQPPPITEVESWVKQRHFPTDKPLVDLCQAVPGYPPPDALIDHLKAAMNTPATFKYTADEGRADVQADICAWYQRLYQGAPAPDQICLTIGASQAFWLALTVLCQSGDEVIIQLPAYFDHLMGLQSLGITPVYAPYDATTGGQPDPALIAGLITPKTRAILLVSPSNPTGAVISTEQVTQLFELARSHDVALVLDETYNAFIGGRPHTLFQRADWPEHFVHLASFGKTFALTGLRAGALIAGEEFIRQALKVHDSMVVCQPHLAQLATQYGCRHLDGWVAQNAAMMRRRHDCFREHFQALDSRFELSASGTFFAWIKHPWTELSGHQAARKLADEANLISLPGEAFGPGLENYLRLAFGNLEVEQIPAAVERFAGF